MEESFPLDRITDIQQHPQDFRLLERVPFTGKEFRDKLPMHVLCTVADEHTFPIVFLDTETTGLYASKDKVIQLSMVRCTYSTDQLKIISIDECFDGFEDPGMPIPQEIVELTGITDAMVRGKHFDEDAIREFIRPGSLIVAHNAAFDRPFFDKRFQNMLQTEALPWACSLEEIDWRKLGFYGTKLEFLAASLGYFYDAHLAINDALTLCYILYRLPAALECLMRSATQCSYKLEAQDTDFKMKDQLKALNFKWDSNRRLWFISSQNAPFMAEIAHKTQSLIDMYGKGQLALYKFTALERYRQDTSRDYRN